MGRKWSRSSQSQEIVASPCYEMAAFVYPMRIRAVDLFREYFLEFNHVKVYASS